MVPDSLIGFRPIGGGPGERERERETHTEMGYQP